MWTGVCCWFAAGGGSLQTGEKRAHCIDDPSWCLVQTQSVVGAVQAYLGAAGIDSKVPHPLDGADKRAGVGVTVHAEQLSLIHI